MKSSWASAASLLALASLPASAADWGFAPRVNSGVEYVDNPRLTTAGGESFEGSRSELAADLTLRTEVAAFSLVPRFVYARYPDEPLLDRSDKYVTLSAQREYETVTWASSTAYTRDTTITSEFGLTGLQNVNRKHENLSFSIGPTWTLSERAQLGAQAYGIDTQYEDAQFTGLLDYEYGLVSVNGLYVMRENLSVGAQASVGELNVAAIEQRTRDINGSVFAEWQAAEQWRMRFAYGPTRVESDRGSAQGHVYSASLTKSNLRSTVQAAVERDVTPTGRGVFVTREKVSLSTSYALTPRASWSLNAQAIRTSDAVDIPGAPAQTNEFASLDSSLRWRCAEYWSVVLAAGGRYLKNVRSTDHAEGFSVSLGLLWHGQPQSLSR